ncbi:MAG: hypothetical protein HYV59_05490 [Planctomycetes bacterium]|nr:hypothetical protein [Planctomycetota bacterium]
MTNKYNQLLLLRDVKDSMMKDKTKRILKLIEFIIDETKKPRYKLYSELNKVT